MGLTLSSVRDTLVRRHQASLSELALEFDADPDAVRGALDIWIAKGRVRRLPSYEACSGCGCGCKGGEVFEWTG